LYGIYKFKTAWKVISITGSALSLLLIVILLTRSVWIAFLFSSSVSYGVLLIYRKTFLLNKKSLRIFIGIPVLAIFIIGIGVFIYSRIGNVEVFEKQTYWIKNYKFGSSLERVDLWEKTIKMSIDHPITGVGQGNWRIIFPTYKLDNLRSETGEVFFQRPHNDFLWVLSENGILGFIFYLLIFIISFFYLFQTIKRSQLIEKKYMALALVFGLTAYVIIAMFSFPKERIEHQIFLHMILAITMVEYEKIKPRQEKKTNALSFTFLTLFLILMILGSYLSVSRLSSEVHIAKATKFRTQGDWENQITEYKHAMTNITQMDAFSTPICWYIGEAWMNLKNTDSAHFYFQKALQVHPYHLHVLNNLGTTYEMKGNHFEAEKLFLKAHELSSGFEDPLFNLCALYYNKGDYLLAYKTILKVDPESENPKYHSYLEAILWKLTNKLANGIPEKIISNSILRIRNDKNWMMKVHEQSIFDSTNYEKQLMIESIYLLESVDSVITQAEAEKYRQKYNLLRM
jgi:tetratricopeptide (TPR) repeat protein